VEAKKVPPLSSSLIIVKLLDIVQGNASRNTRSTKHFQAIYSLEKQTCREDRQIPGIFVSHLSPKEHAQCTVKCFLNGLETDALCDTGAQSSINSHGWLRQCLPGCDIRDIVEFLGMDGSSKERSTRPVANQSTMHVIYIHTYHIQGVHVRERICQSET